MFCTGKIYYELIEERDKRGKENIAFIRMEQLYPVPYEQLDEVISHYPNAKDRYWIQEEPENMGAWSFVLRRFPKGGLTRISQLSSAAPATGSKVRHAARVAKLMDTAFAD